MLRLAIGTIVLAVSVFAQSELEHEVRSLRQARSEPELPGGDKQDLLADTLGQLCVAAP